MAGAVARGWVAILLIQGCEDPAVDTDTDTDADTDTDTDTDTDLAISISHRLSYTIPTVAVVEWETTLEATSWVEFGSPGAWDRSTASKSETGTVHRVALAGLRQASDYEFRVVAQLGDEIVRSEVIAFETGLLPVDLPELSTVLQEPAGREGYTLVPLIPDSEGSSFLVLIDGVGEPVWAWRNTTFAIRAELALDGSAIVFGDMEFGRDQCKPPPGSVDGTVIRSVSLDGEEVVDIAVPGPMPDFAQLGDGWYAALVRESRVIDGTPFIGDRVLRVGPQGQLEPLWSAFDVFEADPASHPDQDFVDWTHANSLDCDLGSGLCFVTVKYLQSIVAFDVQTGETAWVLDLDASGYTTPDPLPVFAQPHSVVAIDEGLLVYDQADPLAGGCSGMMIFDLDVQAGTLQRTWSYASELCLSNDYLGNAEPMENGDSMMSTGCAGVIEEVSAAGELRRRQEAGLGVCLGYAIPVPTLD
jgi:hypothetical protein